MMFEREDEVGDDGRTADRPSRRMVVLDRTGALVVGLVAGFAVGVSFVPASVGFLPSEGPAVVRRTRTVPPAATGAAARAALDPRVLARVERTGRFHVGVFGDSFGIGVWDALYRLLPASEGYDVLRFGREATGFTRYQVTDLTALATKEVAEDPIDVAVVCIGVNDAQDIWDGSLHAFMADDWKRIVGARVDSLVSVARSTGAPVYWVGLPSMRDPQLDTKVQALNAFFEERARRLGVPFFETRALTVDGADRYATHLPYGVTGAPRLMRTGDGIHMIGIGYQRISKDVVERIRADAARAFAAAHRRPATARSEA